MRDTSLKIELYHLQQSRSERVIWAVHELGLENSMTVKPVDYHKGELETDEMKQLNPLKQVPVVVLTDAEGKNFTMTESCAIGVLLSEACDGKLSPPKTDIKSRAKYHRITMMCAANIESMVEAVFKHEFFLPQEKRDPSAAAKGRADFREKGVVIIKQMLGDNQYVCGPDHDEFTIADIMLAWMLWVADKCEMLNEEPVLKDYLQRCLERPAWKKVRG